MAGELEPPVLPLSRMVHFLPSQHQQCFCLSSFQVWRLGKHFRKMIFLVGFGFVKTNQKIDPKYSDLSKVYDYHIFLSNLQR